METSFSDTTNMVRSQRKRSHFRLCTFFCCYDVTLSRLPSYAPTWHKSLLWWHNPHGIHQMVSIHLHFQRPLGRKVVFPYQDEDITQVSPQIQAPRGTIFKELEPSWTLRNDPVLRLPPCGIQLPLWDSTSLVGFNFPCGIQLPKDSQTIRGSKQIRTTARWPWIVTRSHHKRPTSGIIHVSIDKPSGSWEKPRWKQLNHFISYSVIQCSTRTLDIFNSQQRCSVTWKGFPSNCSKCFGKQNLDWMGCAGLSSSGARLQKWRPRKQWNMYKQN